MLSGIYLSNVASYSEEMQKMEGLKTVNFVFGDNGTGKSTIARLIKNCQSPDFTSCQLNWDAGSRITTLVYDREFVNDTLRETQVKGIFTFGNDAGIKQDDLERKKDERNKNETKRNRLQEAATSKQEELDQEEDNLKNNCWSLQQKHKSDFEEAFKGFNKKEKFKSKCLQNVSSTPNYTHDELNKQAQTFFNEQPTKLSLIPTLEVENMSELESSSIFSTKIIGKEDVPIAGLIQELGNSDWVMQGLEFLVDQRCPFCQQSVPETLQQDFENYFDESYTQRMEELSKCIDEYDNKAQNLINLCDNLKSYQNQFFSLNQTGEALESIKVMHKTNLKMLTDKLNKEPSKVVFLENISDKFSEINKEISAANQHIQSFNDKLDNFASEKSKLITEVWKFIGQKAKKYYDDYQKRSIPVSSALKNMRGKIDELSEEITRLNTEISALERDIISTAPSKDGINNILRELGFDNFLLDEAEEEGYYRIVRPDGTHAQKTLSEGERTFITFLYFYQLIQGSFSEDSVDEPKIVVFDDPVSSLDSKILFIVSTLIRSLFCLNTMKRLNIKQIIIFTHNVYFHKEVSFLPGLNKISQTALSKNDFAYWTIRKQSSYSKIIPWNSNPIKTHYQLLWQEVKQCELSPGANISICNTLRRILENYFKILGGIDLAGLESQFTGNEKLAYRSLTSWMHDGSHCLYEGIDVGFGQDLNDLYLPVFKKIFDVLGHPGHYEMMMQSCE